MGVAAINDGLPREVEWQGRSVRTSIFKEPVTGPVRARRLNLDGDRQSDLTVHGRVVNAVSAYPAEHYPFWGEELREPDLSPGAFGENFTTEGLLEETVRIGDRLRIGSAEFVVPQPRTPCFKLQIRFGRLDMVRCFLRSGRSGFYLAVAREGEVEKGDEIALAASDGMTVAEMFRRR